MSSNREDDDGCFNLWPGRIPRARLYGPTARPASFGYMGIAYSAVSAVTEWLLRHQRNRKYSASTLFTKHTCQNKLDHYLSARRSLSGDMMRRRNATALECYMICTGNPQYEDEIKTRSLDLLFLCSACINELVTLTAINSESLHKLVHGSFPVPWSSQTFMHMFEVIVQNAPKVGSLPCWYGGIVDFPVVDLGLCRCILRPLYVAIYYSNVHMMGILLRHGADVRAEDTCRCQEPRRMHPLVRVYNSLACYNNGVPARFFDYMPHSAVFVRCHQLAMLLMPTLDEELREACYGFTRTVLPVGKFEEVVRKKDTLQHMCRVVVRAALAKNEAMPSGVQQLPLPKRLQQYILYNGVLA